MIDPRFIVNLKGKDYPLYQGVLDAATNAGLRFLATTIVQIPAAENGHMAVVLVRAEFEDGRVFESVGDASPANCSPGIATAALRMAETRAGGRAMRAAINCGMTLLEELPDDERRETNGHGHAQAAVREPGARSAGGAAPVRSEPGAGVSAGTGTRRAGDARAAGGAAEPAATEDAVCEWPACGKHLTTNNRLISQKNAQRDLCPEHLTEFRKAKEQAGAS